MLTRTNNGRPFLYIGTIILGLLFALPFSIPSIRPSSRCAMSIP